MNPGNFCAQPLPRPIPSINISQSESFEPRLPGRVGPPLPLRDLSQNSQGGSGVGQDPIDVWSPRLAGLENFAKRPKLLPASGLSHFSPSLLTKSGGPSKPSPPAAGSQGTASGTPEGRQAKGKRAEVHIHTPHSPASRRLAARRRLRSGRTPPGPRSAPPRRRPHPQSFRLPSAHPPRRGSGRVPRGQLEQQAWEQRSSHFLAPEGSVASRLPSVKQARAPRPARACRLLPGAGSREPRRRRAPSSAGESPAATSSRAKSRSPLPRSVGSCVRLSVGPSLPRRRRRSSPGSAACALPASPLCSRARGLAALSLAPCPRRYQRSAERSPAAAGFLASSLSRRGRQRGRDAGGAERRVRGRQRGCALGF